MDSRTYMPLQKIVSEAQHCELLGKSLQGNSGAGLQREDAGQQHWPGLSCSLRCKPRSQCVIEIHQCCSCQGKTTLQVILVH